MTLTTSTMMPLGTRAPDFTLPNVVTGDLVKLQDVAGSEALLVLFMCRHCPYVQHVKKELAKLAYDYLGKGVGIVGISSNDAENFPDDSPSSLAQFAKNEGFPFPLLYDETQQTAKAYTAACTPDIFLFNRDMLLVYRGQLDDSRPDSGRVCTGADLRTALDALLSGKPVPEDQKPSSGCNIKWKPGNEPSYYN